MSIEMTELDKPERKRTYVFPGGETITLEKVTHFLCRESGTHRLKTDDGLYHIVPTGWIHIILDMEDWTL